MQKGMGLGRIIACASIFSFSSAVFAEIEKCPVSVNVRGHENIEWSISYAFHLTDSHKDLPRVLLVGDSICNGYQGRVRALTEGKCNVSYWISSYCVTSPEYLRLLSFHLDGAKYDVVHFNNGLHSLGTDTAAWAKSLKTALELIRAKQPQARIIWATSTPLKDASKTAKARELNTAAQTVVKKLGKIETDDLFALLDPLDREKYWSDVFHHRPEAREREAQQVVRMIMPRAGQTR